MVFIESTPATMHTTARINYIDLLKGFAILWIVWWHTSHPSFVDPYYHVPIFFFISGLFFKPYSLKKYLNKKTTTIIIPFLFFYFISYLFRIALHIWDYRTIEGFPWINIFDIFKCMPNGDYLWVNVPIWFLPCLFNVCIFYFFLSKLPKWTRYLYVLLVVLFTNTITQISTPFFFNDAIRWTAYYALGDMIGKELLTIVKNKKSALIIIAINIIIYAIIYLMPNSEKQISSSVKLNLLTITFIIFVFSFFSFFKKNIITDPLKYYGENSLIVLGLHAPVLIVYQRIIYSIYGCINYWGGLAVFIATSLTMLAIIPIVTRFLPRFVGKAPIKSLKSS